MANYYKWKTDKSYLLRILRTSREAKINAKWSRCILPGFICEDIKRIVLTGKRRFTIAFNWQHKQSFKPNDLNLREIEETIKFLEGQTK